MKNFSLYGLPEKVEHCSNCLMTNQKPHSVNETKSKTGGAKKGMTIHANGLCDACNYNEKKNLEINWEERERLLLEKLDRYRKGNGDYDCLVPGSGGKDSMMTAHILKYKYGMNPLTCTYSPLLYTDVGWKNMRNWIDVGGFDNVLFSANGKVAGILAREALQNLFHPIQPFKFGLKQYASKIALKFGIDLVFYGEPSFEYGSADPLGQTKPDFDAGWYINDEKDLYISGMHIKDIVKKHSLKEVDISPYIPLKSTDVKGSALRIENLGWYLPWNPQEAYYYAVEHCGFISDDQRTDGTYGKYASIDDKFESLHFYCHFIKFGIGRTRFDSSQEIRNGHITREEAISLAAQFEGEFPSRYQDDCLHYMGISENEFETAADNARSPHLWFKKNGEWFLRQELPEIEKLRKV